MISLPKGQIKEILSQNRHMNSRWLHERLKREAIGFPRWRHKYISFQTWFNAAFDWNFTTSNPRRFARIWWIHLILFLVDLFTKLFTLF